MYLSIVKVPKCILYMYVIYSSSNVCIFWCTVNNSNKDIKRLSFYTNHIVNQNSNNECETKTMKSKMFKQWGELQS